MKYELVQNVTAYGEYGYVLYSRVHGLDQMTKLQYTTTKKKT